MLFYFKQIDVVYVLLEPKHVESTMTETIVMESDDVINESPKKEETNHVQSSNGNYKKDNLTYRDKLLHYMSNTLFEIYPNMKLDKQIWDSFEEK